jgi:ABC-type antimicrobial peptide transport system permease subunit
MLKSYLISAIRNLKRNRLYSAINVLGLALGISCCMVIFVIVKYETSFDDYHGKADRIYRVNLNQQTAQGRRLDGCNYSPLAEAIRSDVTGLEEVTGVYCLQVYQFSKDDNLFENKYAFFADQNYFNVFDVKWIAGNQKQALSFPNSVVVTDTFAETFLGGANALGSTFTLENKLTLTVTGIVQAPPTNTDHPYSILISYSSLANYIPETVDNWMTIGAGATYIVFDKNTRQDQIYPQLDKIIQKHLDRDVAKNTEFFLMPLDDNHDRNYDYSSFNYDFPVPVMVILSIIAGMIAFIACVNFVNLATAQSLKRAKEVGLRKTMGSSRVHLIVQYMSEAFVITLCAMMAGLVIARIGMIQLNELYGGNYLQFDLLGSPSTILFITGITVVISILAGFYPAFILSGYKPVLALKSQTYSGKRKGLSIRRGLVICQFAGAQILILVTIIMINQINFFKDRSYSFNPETIVIIPALRGNENKQHEKLNRELTKVEGVITHSFGNVGNETSEFYNDEENRHSGIVSYIDTSYVHVFNVELLTGKNFSSEVIQSSSEVLINESLMKTLGIENPEQAIGSIYTLNNQQVTIRGVLKDSYTQPLSTKVDPISFQYLPKKFTGLAINISTDNIPETLAGIEKAWKDVYPNYLCKYQFMDDSLSREYGFYNIIFSFLGTASFLAIFIGCLGLYGLVSFMAIQRTKEIGIRKVFGATVANIIMMFTKESSILIIVAFVVATPLAHFVGIAMLMEFPERVKPGVGIFIMTLLGSLLIALLTVTYRSFRAAIQNPGESLRVEG